MVTMQQKYTRPLLTAFESRSKETQEEEVKEGGSLEEEVQEGNLRRDIFGLACVVTESWIRVLRCVTSDQ